MIFSKGTGVPAGAPPAPRCLLPLGTARHPPKGPGPRKDDRLRTIASEKHLYLGAVANPRRMRECVRGWDHESAFTTYSSGATGAQADCVEQIIRRLVAFKMWFQKDPLFNRVFAVDKDGVEDKVGPMPSLP